jgi:hypothetical protein
MIPSEVQQVVVALHERLNIMRGAKTIDGRRLNVYRSTAAGRVEILAATLSVADRLLSVDVRRTPAGFRFTGRYRDRDHYLYGYDNLEVEFEATSSEEAARTVVALIAPLIRI